MEPLDLLPYWDDAALDAVLPPRKGRAAYIELHNLIAAAAGSQEYGPDDLVRIGRRHGVDLREAFQTERLAIYAAHLHHALACGAFGEAEGAALAHLARTLHLDATVLRLLHEEAFGRTVSETVSDDGLSVEERLLLYTLQHTLGLDPAEADSAYEAAARERLLVTVARVLCDGELSPAEGKTIAALERALDVRVPGRVAALLDEAAHRWHVLNGPLPRVDVLARLLPGEVGHFSTIGVWREVNYARLRGLLRDHREKLHRGQTADLDVPEGAFLGRKWHEGRIEVTSRRIVLLRDGHKPVAHGLASLAGVELYLNGVRVSVKGARSLFLNAGRDNGALHATLWRALSPSRPSPRA